MGIGRSGWWLGLVLKFFSNLDDSIIWKCFSTSSWTEMFFHQQTDLVILSRSFEQTLGFGSWGATWPHDSAAVGKMLQEARAFPAWGGTMEVTSPQMMLSYHPRGKTEYGGDSKQIQRCLMWFFMLSKPQKYIFATQRSLWLGLRIFKILALSWRDMYICI